jgi:menaquinone-9 beta-reductase
MPDRYDAVVVGARVAGSMTALHLARLGHRVLIVDRAGPPADTLSTHALLRTAVLQLQRAGVLHAVGDAPPVRTIRLGFDDEVIDIPVRDDHGVDALFAPRRTVLDQTLLEAAVGAGADTALGRTVTELIRDESGRIGGVVLGGGAGPVRVPATIVVGADGRNSTVAGLVDAPVERFVPPTNAAVYSYFSDVPTVGFDFRFGPRVSTGAVATNDNLTLVSAGVPTEDFGNPVDTFHRALRAAAPDLADAVEDGHRVERFRFSSGIASFIKVPHGDGWLLVGDAGFTKDPLSAHGISCALRDAELAAQAIHTTLREPTAEHAAASRYAAIRDRFARPLLDHTAALAAYEWDGAGASALMRALGRVTDEECEYLGQTATSPRALVA